MVSIDRFSSDPFFYQIGSGFLFLNFHFAKFGDLIQILLSDSYYISERFLLAMLSSGSINKIISGTHVTNPLFQILAINGLANDDSHYYCYLHDGTNLFIPCVVPNLPEISLVKDSIILLEKYSYNYYISLKQTLLEISSFKLLPSLVTPQATLPDANSSDMSPVNLTASVPGVEQLLDNQNFSGQAGTSHDDEASVHSLPTNLNSASSSRSRCRSVSDFPINFVSASSYYSKKRKLSKTDKIYHIGELFSQSFWTIRGRVLSKGSLGTLTSTPGSHWF
ncbi:uncharacterized protein LOC107367572 isoform X2 [Tetranychus urticae]|uniref:uncharacterized protein LOC107367572 isoform X2 n=1 Tax=Tetranychus urticae TaxID=32264 RepID=UPI00077BA365|nr:uncharacterized protein LOC107367572 isoform X2 [Tetranychus urticae]